MNSRIAEYLMESIDNGGSTPPMTPPLALPDVVASTKHGDKDRDESDKQAKRRSRRQMAKTLQRFHAVSMKRLEVESRSMLYNGCYCSIISFLLILL